MSLGAHTDSQQHDGVRQLIMQLSSVTWEIPCHALGTCFPGADTAAVAVSKC